MSRVADYAIKGFLYQFNKTLLEILKSLDDSVISVEGIVEDVEVATPSTTTMIQCKYHEACEAFTPSTIFKPLLLMAHHFYLNSTANVRYVLFAHYPSMKNAPQKSVQKEYIQDALLSNNKELKKLVAVLNGSLDIDAFLSRFSLEFGPAFDDLVAQAHAALKGSGIPEDDIDILAYPNAINMIAEISVKHAPSDRTTTRRKFLECLQGIRKTAISRWTLALRTRKQLLEARRKQLKAYLDVNTRLRFFIIDPNSLDDSDELVLFIREYLDKYHFKQVHISTPLFCLCVTTKRFLDIQRRLYSKNVISEDGYVGGRFEKSRFFREPLSQKVRGGEIKREFLIRILRWEDHAALLNNPDCDDLFIIGNPDITMTDAPDVNIEHIAATSFKEAKYLMGVSNVYE